LTWRKRSAGRAAIPHGTIAGKLARIPAQVYSFNRRQDMPPCRLRKEPIMSALMHRLTKAPTFLHIVAWSLAVAVTLGAIGGLAHLADQQYSDALLAQELSSPADDVFFSSPLLR
jgi:hypothetical protein